MDQSPAPLIVEALTAEHDLSQFDCGQPELTDWLKRFALMNQRAGGTRIYVLQLKGRVIGYYALAAGSSARDLAPPRVGQGLANHPIPVIVLARLAIDESEQGHGLGAALLKDAMLRAAHAADLIGVRALIVHAKNDDAARFYERVGFLPFGADSQDLYLLLSDIRRRRP